MLSEQSVPHQPSPGVQQLQQLLSICLGGGCEEDYLRQGREEKERRIGGGRIVGAMFKLQISFIIHVHIGTGFQCPMQMFLKWGLPAHLKHLGHSLQEISEVWSESYIHIILIVLIVH